ncbi:protein naked cuticle homolog [Periplaneta americana]|uniref:protein naked cuticle homolog n=1 Tax=Periplaneta americana TaxID=6978 RepID=UPI0037E91341
MHKNVFRDCILHTEVNSPTASLAGPKSGRRIKSRSNAVKDLPGLEPSTTGRKAVVSSKKSARPAPGCRCLPPSCRKHFSKILSVLTRRLRLRRYTRLGAGAGTGIHLRVEEASENETSCTILVPTDCSDGRPSDTEELLGRHDYSAANEKDVCEEKQHQPNNTKNSAPNPERRQLNIEEFECDLSVEGGVDLGGQERQEFSFTLYDFDGHGKITKDDIAGLVTTIYDTLGSSIKVPHYGSKTIKVKLTVSPDQRKKDVAQDAVPVLGEETSNNNNNVKCSNTCAGSGGPSPHQGSSTHRVKFKRDLNVTIRESRMPRRMHRRRRCSGGGGAGGGGVGGGGVPVTEDKYANSCSSSCRSGASENNDDGAADISEDDNDEDLAHEDDMPLDRELGSQHSTPKISRDSTGRTHARRYQQHSAARYRHQHGVYCSGETNTPQLLRQRSKKRSSSLQREELLQIIQANMEKNNLSFQTSRKQCSDRGGLGDHRHSHYRHRHKLPPQQQPHEDGVAAQVQLHCLANVGEYPSFTQDPHNNCYLDLAGFEPSRTFSKTQRCHYDQECRYDKFLGAVVCASSKHASTGYHQPYRARGHHRSRSHDLSHAANSFQYHLLDPSNEPLHRGYTEGTASQGYHHGRLGHHTRSKSHEAEYGNLEQNRMPAYRQQERKFPPIVLGHSSSPHHLKHRNREQDQARAMKQVMRWLDQEFSSGLNTTEKLNAKNAATTTQTETKTPPLTPSRNAKQIHNQTPGSPKKDETPNSPSASSVERHEHHHVHEHIHHHYHHYQETPVLV